MLKRDFRTRELAPAFGLQCPISTLSPAMGKTCGRREREADGEGIPRIHLSSSQRWKAPRFAGCRAPSRALGTTRVLVGPSRSMWGSFPIDASHRRQQVPSGRMRRGTSSACARRMHSVPGRPTSELEARGHVLRSVQRPVHVDRTLVYAVDSVSKLGKPAQVGGTIVGAGSSGRMRGSPRATITFA
jgi:hypothetical protein